MSMDYVNVKFKALIDLKLSIGNSFYKLRVFILYNPSHGNVYFI
jgi:hypothetical protein